MNSLLGVHAVARAGREFPAPARGRCWRTQLITLAAYAAEWDRDSGGGAHHAALAELPAPLVGVALATMTAGLIGSHEPEVGSLHLALPEFAGFSEQPAMCMKFFRRV